MQEKQIKHNPQPQEILTEAEISARLRAEARTRKDFDDELGHAFR